MDGVDRREIRSGLVDDILDPLRLHQSYQRFWDIAQLLTDVISSSFHAHNASHDALMSGMIHPVFGKRKIVKKY